MPDAAAQRQFALQIVEKLRAAGFEALWAGGCVRDEMLGLAPKDYDVASSATPDEIRAVFGRRRTLAIGAAFGVITVLGPRPAGQVEVATFRTDAQYSDGRRPDSVSFTDAEHDVQRRDFTINGLFFDPIGGQVIDYVGGQLDIQQRIIRAIGDPRLRLREDKLRMLRAVRFAATFDFTIEPATLNAIQEMAAEIIAVSAERIGMEIRRMLVGPDRAAALRLLHETKLLPHVLPEIAALLPAAFDETVRTLAALREPSLPLALAALLQNAHTLVERSPQNALNRAPRDASLIQTVAHRLRYTNKETDRSVWLLANLTAIADAPQLAWPKLQRLLIHDGAGELLALHEAIVGGHDSALSFCREILAWPPEKLNPPPLVDGRDLIRHGLSPGPQFSALLEQIRDAQLNGEIRTREEALILADSLRRDPEPLP
jgi:poly(A) polymerase